MYEWEFGGCNPGPCPVVSFGISSLECLGSDTRGLVIWKLEAARGSHWYLL